MSVTNIIRRHGLGTLTALLLGLIFVSGGAYGSSGFQKQMEDGFNAMASVTKPQIVNGSIRGEISGGSFTVRHKVKGPIGSPIGWRLPSVNIGCGGWDIFGGSFSVISSDQVIAMLRAIAASAVAYAFKLALSTISDKVAQNMELLWKDNTFFNMMGKNSCELGQALVDSTLGAFKTKANQRGSNEAVETGIKDDSAEATNNLKADTPAMEAAKRNQDDPEALKAIIEGNHIWNAMRAHPSSAWTLFGGDAFIEDVMSVVGTIIQCAPNVKGCPGTGGVAVGGQNDVVMIKRESLIGLRQLVKGEVGNSEMKRWVCNEKTLCLNPIAQPLSNYVGIEEKLRKALLGETEGLGQGIIGRQAWNLPMEPGEGGIITAGGDYVELAFRLANQNENSARHYVEHFSEIMAAEIAYEIIDEALVKVLEAVSQYEGGTAVDAQKLVREARLELGMAFRTMQGENQNNNGKLDYFLGVVNASPRFSLPGISVPVRH